MSGDIYAEYEGVIRRPRFNRSDGEIEATLRTIRDKGFWAKPTEKVRACSDPDDDIFLEMSAPIKDVGPRTLHSAVPDRDSLGYLNGVRAYRERPESTGHIEVFDNDFVDWTP